MRRGRGKVKFLLSNRITYVLFRAYPLFRTLRVGDRRGKNISTICRIFFIKKFFTRQSPKYLRDCWLCRYRTPMFFYAQCSKESIRDNSYTNRSKEQKLLSSFYTKLNECSSSSCTKKSWYFEYLHRVSHWLITNTFDESSIAKFLRYEKDYPRRITSPCETLRLSYETFYKSKWLLARRFERFQSHVPSCMSTRNFKTLITGDFCYR